MGHEDDPRLDPAPLAEIPALVAEGASLYNEGRFWDAHEAWERAWHALKAHGKPEEAEFLQGLVLVTAGFENLRRGKPRGFRTQLGKALLLFERFQGKGTALGLVEEARFVGAVGAVLRDAEAHPTLARLEDLGLPPPRLRVAA